MKIMSAHSWICRCHSARSRSHNGISGFGTGPDIHPTLKEIIMTWEKPQASDMRWGFEITMYIANR
ncbi:pyrroloquinoline quinone precursor peptide PqqA [Noviherbaspirillum sp. L7-7A]|uniref:pyrroloquinoline quinone precursor peptide PqqA n=1 Tax=Noviherbaspirillum sp. L7-7A TaxID=2850560 RepID=UPI00201218C5|nr:pyrroloquinoline quinone precursor peptide PqqA [Noviherbaspirillum sp. L7-7A]